MLSSKSQHTGDDEVGPAWRLLKSNALDVQVCGVLRVEQDWSKVGIGWILNMISCEICKIEGSKTHQNFTAGESIIPSLAIAIQRSVAINLDVLASPFPERDALLEWMVEIVLLPVSDIVGELVRC